MSPKDTAKDRAAAPPTIMHTVECGRSSFVIPNREKEAMVREGIARMVAVLAEAGGPVPATDVCRRLHEDGGIPYWPEVQMTALDEMTVWSPEDGMLCLPQKIGPGVSPEARAMHLAFEKARKLGVIRHTGERYVLASQRDSDPLNASELEKAERWMNRCNALGTSDAKRMYRLWYGGKVTRDELDAFTNDAIRNADEQPLANAQDGARGQKGAD